MLVLIGSRPDSCPYHAWTPPGTILASEHFRIEVLAHQTLLTCSNFQSLSTFWLILHKSPRFLYAVCVLTSSRSTKAFVAPIAYSPLSRALLKRVVLLLMGSQSLPRTAARLWYNTITTTVTYGDIHGPLVQQDV